MRTIPSPPPSAIKVPVGEQFLIGILCVTELTNEKAMNTCCLLIIVRLLITKLGKAGRQTQAMGVALVKCIKQGRDNNRRGPLSAIVLSRM